MSHAPTAVETGETEDRAKGYAVSRWNVGAEKTFVGTGANPGTAWTFSRNGSRWGPVGTPGLDPCPVVVSGVATGEAGGRGPGTLYRLCKSPVNLGNNVFPFPRDSGFARVQLGSPSPAIHLAPWARPASISGVAQGPLTFSPTTQPAAAAASATATPRCVRPLPGSGPTASSPTSAWVRRAPKAASEGPLPAQVGPGLLWAILQWWEGGEG